MTKLIFYTPTILPKACLFTMGVSVKKTANPFGFFGTGLKYAVASVIRLGGQITIELNHDDNQIPNQTLEFDRYNEVVRDKNFSMIECRISENGVVVDKQQMPMVVDYGKTWQSWQALRELYTNTVDEGGEIWIEEMPQVIRGCTGTYITVECDEILAAWSDRFETWLFNADEMKPVWSDHMIEVYLEPSHALYYHGIRVSGDDFQSALTYNLKRLVGNLTEDRTYDIWSFKCHFSKNLIKMTSPNACRRLLEATGNERMVESGFFLSMIHKDGSIQMQEIALELHQVSPQLLSRSATDSVNTYMRIHNFDEFYKEALIVGIDKRRCDTCTKLVNKYLPIHKYRIRWTEDLDTKLGIADPETRTIVININHTIRNIDWKRKTCTTLIEEFIHLEHQADDYSRYFQNTLLDLAYDLMQTRKR